MKIPTKSLIGLGLFSSLFQLLAAAESNDVEKIITTARQYLGKEERIKAIHTIQYIGRFEATSDASSGNIQIILSRPMKQHGVVINKGRVRKSGRVANLLVFQYEDDLFFERYFDVETGELIATVTDQGLEMRELGEIIVEGVRFPDRVVSLINGEVVNTVFFDEIKVNEEIDQDAFKMPSLLPSKR